MHSLASAKIWPMPMPPSLDRSASRRCWNCSAVALVRSVVTAGHYRLPAMADLDAVEARVWSLLDPYRGELEAATIYGLPSLRWPGAKAHDYFAAVKKGAKFVSLYLLVADTYPDALTDAPPTLIKRRSGKAAFNFPTLDDEMARDLGALLGRLYDSYRADHI